MATAVQSPASVELFYSYAHNDEPLCQELQKHLTALKRSGLIRDWYDRKIEPGDEWNAQIQEALERAGIILLLISADFLASKYIFDVEVPFALKRHDSGSARVIPILLRPVEWHGLPFAKLQILPTEARAVTSWTNRDEAFTDIAAKLRELLYADRLHLVTPPLAPDHGPRTTQERVLDAAIASSVVIDEPTDLVTMVRGTESGGLKAILRVDRTYSATSDDVRSERFELDFPADASGTILPATLELALQSPGFDPPSQRKKLRIPPAGDSGVSVFMFTAKRAGTLRLNLQALSGDIEIGSCTMATTSVPADQAQPILSYGVTSLPLKPSTEAPARTTAAAPPPIVQYTRKFEKIDPQMYSSAQTSGRYDTSAPPNFPGAPPRPPLSQPPAPITVGAPRQSAPPARSRSNRSAWIGIGSAAAAIALVCTAITFNRTAVVRPAPPVASESATPASEPAPGISGLNEAIKRQPNAPELYLQRAQALQRAGQTNAALADAKHATELAPNNVQAHLVYAQLLENANLTAQAIQQYTKVEALKATPEQRSLAAQRAAALEQRTTAPHR